MKINSLKGEETYYTDHLPPTKQKYLIFFDIDVAAMGQTVRWF